jgi:hypothetical protein
MSIINYLVHYDKECRRKIILVSRNINSFCIAYCISLKQLFAEMMSNVGKTRTHARTHTHTYVDFTVHLWLYSD